MPLSTSSFAGDESACKPQVLNHQRRRERLTLSRNLNLKSSPFCNALEANIPLDRNSPIGTGLETYLYLPDP
jgi:hypothetical protein